MNLKELIEMLKLLQEEKEIKFNFRLHRYLNHFNNCGISFEYLAKFLKECENSECFEENNKAE